MGCRPDFTQHKLLGLFLSNICEQNQEPFKFIGDELNLPRVIIFDIGNKNSYQYAVKGWDGGQLAEGFLGCTVVKFMIASWL